MMKRLRITVCALLVLMLLSGCAASQSSMKATTEESYNYAYDTAAAEEPAYEPETSMTTAESESAAGGFDAGEADPNYGNHKIITTYSFEMRTDEFDNHFKQLQDKAAQLGGYVQSSSVSGTKPETYSDYGRTANLTFRIPTAKVKEFVDFTQGTGEITYSNCDTEDITLNYFDTETRLGVLRDQLDRLKEIMKTTGNMEDLVELEKAISETTLEIEQYTTQLRRYDDLVDYQREPPHQRPCRKGRHGRAYVRGAFGELRGGRRIPRERTGSHSMRNTRDTGDRGAGRDSCAHSEAHKEGESQECRKARGKGAGAAGTNGKAQRQ